MKKTKTEKMGHPAKNQHNENRSKRVLMKCSGKFLHGTRGKPGRGPHGDKHY